MPHSLRGGTSFFVLLSIKMIDTNSMRGKLLLLFFWLSLVFVQAETVKFHDAEYTVFCPDLGVDHIGLYWKDDAGTRLGSFRRLKEYVEARGSKLEFAMNAGIFSPEYSPMGLHVAAGKEETPLNLADGAGNFFLKPNGVFYIQKKVPAIAETTQYAALKIHPEMAVQSGPLLVSKGHLHPAFRADSLNRYIRNGVGIDAKGKVIFAISNVPVTLYEFATFFKESLHCNNALYLDGAISRYYSPELGSDFLEGNFAGILAVTRP